MSQIWMCLHSHTHSWESRSVWNYCEKIADHPDIWVTFYWVEHRKMLGRSDFSYHGILFYPEERNFILKNNNLWYYSFFTFAIYFRMVKIGRKDRKMFYFHQCLYSGAIVLEYIILNPFLCCFFLSHFLLFTRIPSFRNDLHRSLFQVHYCSLFSSSFRKITLKMNRFSKE